MLLPKPVLLSQRISQVACGSRPQTVLQNVIMNLASLQADGVETIVIMDLILHLLALPIKILSILALCQAQDDFVL